MPGCGQQWWGIVVFTVLAPFHGVGAEGLFTTQFPLDACRFSVFGDGPHLILNPGHQLVLGGEVDGQREVLTITVLDDTRIVTLPHSGSVRSVLTRVIEERHTVGGTLVEVARNLHARCVDSGDVYYFGEEVDVYEDGGVVGHAGSWLAGTNGASPGLVMPRTFLLGARYVHAVAPPVVHTQAEHVGMGVPVDTPAGSFPDCVQVEERDPFEPGNPPALKAYAPGVGLVDDQGTLRLEAVHLGVTATLPRGGRLVPYSSHWFFPLSPGRGWRLAGVDAGLPVTLTIRVLEAVQLIPTTIGGVPTDVRSCVVEERLFRNDRLERVTRKFCVQCLETEDVYLLGEAVDRWVDGVVVDHEGTWRVGEAGARVGLMMPGTMSRYGQYDRAAVPGVAERQAINAAADISRPVPAGDFSGCVLVLETDRLRAGTPAVEMVYAPGVGLISAGPVLALTVLTIPGVGSAGPMLSVQDAVLLSWPATEATLRVESSPDLVDWTPLLQPALPFDGRNQVSVPRDWSRKYFRLIQP